MAKKRKGARETAEAFIRQIQSDKASHPIYYVWGEESYLLDVAVDVICKTAAPEGLNDFNYELLRGKDTSGERLLSAVEMLPFMCPKRVVVLRDMQEMDTNQLKSIDSYLDDPNPTTCLVIHAMTAQKKPNGNLGVMRKLKKVSKNCKFELFREWEATESLKREAKRRHLTLDHGVDAHIIAAVGCRLADIVQALEKIDLFLGGTGQRRVSLETIGEVIAHTRTESVFDLTNALGNKNLQESIRILDSMMHMGESAIGINTMIARHFRIMAKLQDPTLRNASSGEQARGAGVSPFFLKEYSRHSRLFGPRDTQRVLAQLCETDRLLKSSRLADRTIMEGLLLDIVLGSGPRERRHA